MSGARGYKYWPISVFPLPSLAWHCEQWSAKCSRASFKTSGVATVAHGFSSSRSILGMAMWRTARATAVSMAEGSLLALIPRRIKRVPYAIAANTTPSTSHRTALGIFMTASFLSFRFQSIIFHSLKMDEFARTRLCRQAASHRWVSASLPRHRPSLAYPGPKPHAESNRHHDHSRRCTPGRGQSVVPGNLGEVDFLPESAHSSGPHFQCASTHNCGRENARLIREHSC